MRSRYIPFLLTRKTVFTACKYRGKLTFESGQVNVRIIVEIVCFSFSIIFALEQVSEDVTEAYVYADLYGFLAVIYVFCVPHFYHDYCN